MPRWPRKKPEDHLDMSNNLPEVEWQKRESFKTFGNRLDFLSPEQGHLQTGKLTILPAKERQ